MTSTVLARHSLKTRMTLAMLAVFLVGLWSLSYYATRMLREDMERLLGEQQYSTVSLVAAQVNRELSERIAALQTVAGLSAGALQKGPAATQAFIEQRTVMHALFNAGVFVTGTDGIPIADVPLSTGRIGVNVMDRDYMAGALGEGRATIGRPILGRLSKAPTIVMAVPIRDDRGMIIGALAGLINLAIPNFLDEITESHYGRSGGYLLDAPQYGLVVTATDKRRIMETLPDSDFTSALDRLIESDERWAVTVDAHGAEVLVSARGIPAAGWRMVATLPADEAFAPIKSMQRRMWLATLLLTLAAGWASWLMARRQLAPLRDAARSLLASVESGQPLQQLRIAKADEIGQLIDGFNGLLNALAEQKAALRESEVRYKAMHDAAFTGIAIHDGEIVLDCNQGLLDLTGYTFDEIVGSDGFNRLIALGWRELVELHCQNGLDRPCEVEGLHKNGTRYPLSVRGKDFSYQDRVVRVVEFSDVTERRQMEAALRDSYEALRSILETTKDGFWRIDPRGHLTDVNPAYCRQSGYAREELLGMHIAGLEASESFAETTEHMQRIRQTLSEQFESTHRRKDGSLWHVEVSATYRNVSGGEFFAFLRDIAERKLAEAKLVASETRLQTLIQTLPDLIWLKNAEGVYLACNNRFERFFGASEQEIVGRTDYDFVDRDLADFFREHDRLAMARGSPSVNEEWITFADDGHRELLETTKTPMFDAQGRLIGVLGIGHDITERKLAEQQQRIAAIAFECQEGMFVTDAARVIIRVNRAFSRITGYTAEEAVGWTPRLFRSGRHDEAFYAAMMESLRSTGSWVGEIWNRRKNGEVYPQWLTISAVRDETGAITHYVATMNDVTARKRADDELRKLSLAVAQSPVSIVITDLDGCIEYVNPAFSQTSGYSAAEALENNPRLLKSGRTPPETYVDLWATLVEGKVWRGEFINRRKDGSEYLEAATISPVRQPDGRVTHYLAVKEDITGMMRAMSDLRLSEDRLRLAKTAAGLGIFDWDIVSGEGEWDERARELCGVGPDEPITSATLREGIPRDERESVQADIDRALDPRGSGEYRAEYRVINPVDGSARQIAANGQVVFDDGRAIRLVGTLKDVTRQKQLEREVQERRSGMESLVNQQVAAHTAAAIAHELNQPLVAVSAYSEAALRILRGARNPEKLAHALEGAMEQAQRAGRTLHELLDFLHKGEAPSESVELESVVREALAIAEEGGCGGFRHVIGLERDLPPVMANRLQLQKVLVNLLHNGVEAMRHDGVEEEVITITVRTRIGRSNKGGRMVQVTVQDCGPGLDADTAHRIFDPFFTTKTDGVGLGLAISRALIEAHDGQLWADVGARPGATFHFILPFAS